MKHLQPLFRIACFVILLLASHRLFTGFMTEQVLNATDVELSQQTRELDAEGFILREERVVEAPTAGKVELLAEQGQRVGVHEPVAKIHYEEEETENVHLQTAPSSGLISYKFDGLEVPLKSRPAGFSIGELLDTQIDEHRVEDGSLLDSGEPLFKIIDNNEPLFFALLIEDEKFALVGDQRLAWAGLVINGNSFQASLVSTAQHGRARVAYFQLRHPADDTYLRPRTVNTRIVLGDKELAVLPRRALQMGRDQYRVYLREDGEEIRATGVRVISKDRKTAHVQGVKEGEVLLNPHFVVLWEELLAE